MAERILGPQGSKRRKRFLWVPALLIACLALFVVGSAQAVHDETFQLDGNVLAASTTNYGGHAQSFDWDSFFDSSGNAKQASFPDASVPDFTASGFQRDFNTTANNTYDTSDATTFTTGSKDTLNISTGWACTSANNVTDKGDIQNAYAVAYTDPVSGDQFLYFGMERNSNNGDANVAFWFLQGNANCTSPTGPGSSAWTGDHVDGDILIVSAFTKGGVVSTINAYRWNGGAGGSLGTTPVASGGDCSATNPPAPLGDVSCATANQVGITTPWLTNNNGKTNGLGHSLLTGEFFEGGINLTDSNLAGKCFNEFVGDTRSSQSLGATIFDYARGSLGECKSTTVTTPTPSGSSEIPANAQVTSSDSAVITVNGTPKFSGTVKFFLCGPGVDASANCSTGGVQIGSTQTLTDVTSPQTVVSSSATLTKVGKYCWRAEYSGDSVRTVPPSTDPKNTTDQSECFTLTPKTPSLATAAGAGPVDFGNPVTDTATLSGTANEPGTGGLGDGSINPTGGNGPAQGTITFTLYKADCSTVATGTGTNPQTVSVNGNGTYGPVSFTPDAPGTYHWVASYSGDPPNTNGTNHNTTCNDTGEDVVVRQITTHIKTRQSWIPNDTATVSADVGNLVDGGSVRFQLFASSTCSGTALYDQTVSVPGGNPSAEVSTTNTGGATGFTITSGYTDTAGSIKGPYSWKVVYTPAATDTAHLGTQSSCNAEHFSITYTNDPGPN
jgi:hypothetical protein